MWAIGQWAIFLNEIHMQGFLTKEFLFLHWSHNWSKSLFTFLSLYSSSTCPASFRWWSHAETSRRLHAFSSGWISEEGSLGRRIENCMQIFTSVSCYLGKKIGERELVQKLYNLHFILPCLGKLIKVIIMGGKEKVDLTLRLGELFISSLLPKTNGSSWIPECFRRIFFSNMARDSVQALTSLRNGEAVDMIAPRKCPVAGPRESLCSALGNEAAWTLTTSTLKGEEWSWLNTR